MSETSQTGHEAATYARRVGERLRGIRRQKGLSLQDVEASSGQEFRASVLGAYERGERSISVPRLQRLARFYSVPVDQLLPSDAVIDLSALESEEGKVTGVTARRPRVAPGAGSHITLDLTALERSTELVADPLRRYLNQIQIERQDFNGRILSIRHDDLRALACLLGTDAAGVTDRLEELGLSVAT